MHFGSNSSSSYNYSVLDEESEKILLSGKTASDFTSSLKAYAENHDRIPPADLFSFVVSLTITKFVNQNLVDAFAGLLEKRKDLIQTLLQEPSLLYYLSKDVNRGPSMSMSTAAYSRKNRIDILLTKANDKLDLTEKANCTKIREQRLQASVLNETDKALLESDIQKRSQKYEWFSSSKSSPQKQASASFLSKAGIQKESEWNKAIKAITSFVPGDVAHNQTNCPVIAEQLFKGLSEKSEKNIGIDDTYLRNAAYIFAFSNSHDLNDPFLMGEKDRYSYKNRLIFIKYLIEILAQDNLSDIIKQRVMQGIAQQVVLSNFSTLDYSQRDQMLALLFNSKNFTLLHNEVERNGSVLEIQQSVRKIYALCVSAKLYDLLNAGKNSDNSSRNTDWAKIIATFPNAPAWPVFNLDATTSQVEGVVIPTNEWAPINQRAKNDQARDVLKLTGFQGWMARWTWLKSNPEVSKNNKSFHWIAAFWTDSKYYISHKELLAAPVSFLIPTGRKQGGGASQGGGVQKHDRLYQVVRGEEDTAVDLSQLGESDLVQSIGHVETLFGHGEGLTATHPYNLTTTATAINSLKGNPSGKSDELTYTAVEGDLLQEDIVEILKPYNKSSTKDDKVKELVEILYKRPLNQINQLLNALSSIFPNNSLAQRDFVENLDMAMKKIDKQLETRTKYNILSPAKDKQEWNKLKAKVQEKLPKLQSSLVETHEAVGERGRKLVGTAERSNNMNDSAGSFNKATRKMN